MSTAAPFRERVSYQAMLLGGFSFIATALLVIGNLATRDAIDERRREDLRASLAQVVPAAVHDNDLLANPLSVIDDAGLPLTVYRGTVGLHVTALAWEIVGKGYSGDIRLILGVNTAGEVLGVRVLSHAETPGLGDKIEVARDDWILGFDGLSLRDPPIERWKVDKDGGRFDAFSGATITPRAVVDAVRGGLEFFRRHRTALVNPVVITTPSLSQESAE
ncbi:MAG: electron transport complex subunit RsxG [Gammaproteobacteria bacterium]|nr:electron transport complex subunit RsxG [Gammaproteobacteria bacterium]